jgi:hypothetical protein
MAKKLKLGDFVQVSLDRKYSNANPALIYMVTGIFCANFLTSEEVGPDVDPELLLHASVKLHPVNLGDARSARARIKDCDLLARCRSFARGI